MRKYLKLTILKVDESTKVNNNIIIMRLVPSVGGRGGTVSELFLVQSGNFDGGHHE